MNTVIAKKTSILFSVRTKHWLSFCICLLCVFLFVISAYDKIAEHERFRNGLSKVAIIGSYAYIISWLVPIVEMVVALLLIIPKTQKYGLFGFLLVMIVFTIYIGGMWLWAEKLPCHCNLIIEKLSWAEHVVFNLAFIGLAACVIWFMKNKQY